jgi:addiction module HigA family antidote
MLKSSIITGDAMLPKKRPPTHPGEMLLKEFLEPGGVTQKRFAEHVGWTYARLNEIINGRRGITAESALVLGDALKTGPELWMNLQRDWDLWHSMQNHEKIPQLKKTG